ncbi:reverse transcriptase domain-containing protein [Tanacetum coccineum]
MPDTLGCAEASKNLHDFYHGPMAILPIGHGHLETSSSSFQKDQVCDRGYRLLHEVDRSQTVGQNHSWCTRLNIQHMNTAVAHLQANGLVERANKSLMEGIKTRLGKENVGWVDELPSVLWAHRTSIKTSNGETPFSLTYGSEAITLAEIGISTYRTMMIKEGSMRRRSVLT